MIINQYIILRDKETKLPYLCKIKECKWNNKLNSYKKIVDFFNHTFYMNLADEEYVYILSLDTQMQPIGIFQVSHGTATTSHCGRREIALFLILSGANNFILLHNHPSGVVKMSGDDMASINEIQEVATTLGVNYVQDLVIGGDKFNNGIYCEELDTDEMNMNDINENEFLYDREDDDWLPFGLHKDDEDEEDDGLPF